MLILRIRQAEVAANAGRLDEAFELVARDGRFRSHRRGQDAITRIVDALVGRGREHLAAGRWTLAGSDCDKAARLGGGDLPAVAQLRGDLAAEHDGRRRGERHAALALAAARRHVEEGALSVGRQLLASVDDSRAKRLMDDIDDQRTRLDKSLAAARAAADRRDWPAAAAEVARGRAIVPGDGRVADLAAEVAAELVKQAQSEVVAGRLDRAGETVGHLRQADPDAGIARDVDRVREACARAWALIAQGRPNDAAEALRPVDVLFPKTQWLGEALKQLQVAADVMGQLRAGPLSLVSDGFSAKGQATTLPHVGTPAGVIRTAPAMRPSPATAAAAHASHELPDRFILQIDGAGAFLVVRSPIAKVGPISSSALPDVALVADATAPAVTIERLEDDYFLRSPSPIALNDKPATERLLASGDRIGLSPRCRFTFALPHPASTTAVLDLVGARYPRGDVRRVILLDRDLILGPSNAAHARVSGLAQPVVLNLRQGVLRTSVEATASGRPVPRGEGLPIGVPIMAGGVSFVISRV